MKRFYHTQWFRYMGMMMGALVWLANGNNPPNANTGSPFNGNCQSCHDTPTASYNGDVTITVGSGVSTIDPNVVYPITLTLDPTAGTPVTGGYQLVVVDGTSGTWANCGDLAALNTQSGTEMSGGREYIEQRGEKNFNGGPISWTFNWTSPASVPSGTVQFYFIGNFSNNNNQDTGDKIVWSSTFLPFAGPPPVYTTASSTAVLCPGGNTGTATAEPTGGTGTYTYAWNNGQTNQTATNLIAGTYTVTVTSGATATATVVVTQPPAITLSASSSGAINCNQTSSTLSATANGGTPGYSFVWSNGDSGQQTSVSAGGTYTVTLTDNNNCTKTASVSVTANVTPPVANAGNNATLTCQTTQVQLSGAGSSTGAQYTYLWTTVNGHIVSGGNTLTPTVDACGTYDLQVTNTSNGCTSTDQVAVVCQIVPPGADATGNTLTCAAPSAPIMASSPTTGVTYKWGGPGITAANQNQQNPVVNAAGTYTVTVTNPANNCTSTATTTVTSAIVAPSATATAGTLSCSNTSTTLNAVSNASGATYLWSGPGITAANQNQQNPVVTVAGVYTVTVTNPANSCTNTASATVTSNTQAPGASAVGGTLTCVAPTITLVATSGTSGVSYSWTGPGITGANQNQQNPVVSICGAYTVTVNNPVNGCTSTASATISCDQAPPNLTTTNLTLTCSNPSGQVCANSTTSGVTFAWTGGSNQACVTVNQPGTYSVVATNTGNGCTTAGSATVSIDITAPVAQIATPANLNCVNSSVQLNGNASSQGAAFTYLWTTSNGNISAGATTLSPTVSAVGTYVLTVNNLNNGCTSTASVGVNASPAIVATSSSTPVSCNGGSNGTALVSASGGAGTYTYLWSNSSTSAAVSGLAAGTYTATITDAETCTKTTSVTIAQPNPLAANASATAQTAVGLNDGTATAAPTGGTSAYSYLWSTNGTTASISGLAPGSYTVSVTDANNCSVVQTVTVNSFNCALSASISSVNPACNGAANGSASLNVVGANLPVVYLWNNGASTQSISGLSAGTYTASITDANGCPAVLSTTLNEPPVLFANATATGLSAAGANDGTATTAPTGGTAPYSYLWSTGATTASISGLAPGTYTVSVTDANACSAVQSATVNAFNCSLALSVSNVPVTCFGLSTGVATATVSGANGTVAYLWSNNNTGSSINGLQAGTYTVSATDGAGCVSTATTIVPQPSPLSASAVVTNASCPQTANGSAVINATGGTAPYTIPALINLPVGSYTATVTDGNGCNASTSFTIVSADIQPPTINCPNTLTICQTPTEVYPLPTATDNCGQVNSPVLLSGVPSGSAFPVGTTTQVFSVTDGSGNSATCSFNVVVLPLPTVSINSVQNDQNGAGTGSIDITASGAGPFTYNWTKDGQFFSNSEDLSGLTSGNYELQITDANGCKTTLPVIKVDNTVGTFTPNAQPSLRLWPNPTAAYLHLEFSNVEPVSAQILDVRGRVLSLLDAGMLQEAIAVDVLPSGLYYLKIQAADGKMLLAKWVKE